MTPTLDITTLPVRSTLPQREPTAELEQKALDWPGRAAAVKIVDQGSYDAAVELLKAAKALRNEAEEHHRPMIDAAYKTHKATIAALKRVDEPLASAETSIKCKIGIWDREQEMRRIEAERKAREEAERIAAEQLEAELEAIEAAGAKPEEVAAVIREAEQVPVYAPVAPPTYARAAGITNTTRWSATVTNMPAFIAWVAMNKQYSTLLKVDQAALNNLARSMQSNLKIPGVTVTPTTTIGVR